MTLLAFAGWTGSGLFFVRSLLQWVQSERAGRSVVPLSFWRISLCGSVCVTLYTASLGEFVLALGAAVNGVLYLRNLLLARAPSRSRLDARAATAGAIGIGALLAVLGYAKAVATRGHSLAWVWVSILGQGLWSSRFALQWWYAERRASESLPSAFWWVSLVGNGLLLSYCLHLGDPVLIAGFALGPISQVRNLVLLGRRGVGERTVSVTFLHLPARVEDFLATGRVKKSD